MKPSILVVEDDMDMAEMIGTVLSMNFNVTVCSGKASAIKEAKAYLKEHGPPQGLVLDLIINGEGGLDLYNWMHRQGMYSPVIFLTGCHSQSPEYIAAVETGERVYDKDNFSSSQLVAFVDQMVADSESEKEGEVALPA